MNERVITETVDPNWDQMPTEDIDNESDGQQFQGVTIEDLEGFDFYSFIEQQSQSTSHSIRGQQSTPYDCYPIVDHLSDYMTSEDEEFGNSLIIASSDQHNSTQTACHSSHTSSSASSSSCVTSEPSTNTLRSNELTIGQPLVSGSADSLSMEDTLLLSDINSKFDFSSDLLDTTLEIQSKPTIRVIDLVSDSYRPKRRQLMRRARRLQFTRSRGSANVWIRCMDRITDVSPPTLTGMIKMGPKSERKTGTKGSYTGKCVHRLSVLSGVVTITVDNQPNVVKSDQMIKIRKHSHYFITNSESNESLVYFKVSLN